MIIIFYYDYFRYIEYTYVITELTSRPHASTVDVICKRIMPIHEFTEPFGFYNSATYQHY